MPVNRMPHDLLHGLGQTEFLPTEGSPPFPMFGRGTILDIAARCANKAAAPTCPKPSRGRELHVGVGTGETDSGPMLMTMLRKFGGFGVFQRQMMMSSTVAELRRGRGNRPVLQWAHLHPDRCRVPAMNGNGIRGSANGQRTFIPDRPPHHGVRPGGRSRQPPQGTHQQARQACRLLCGKEPDHRFCTVECHQLRNTAAQRGHPVQGALADPPTCSWAGTSSPPVAARGWTYFRPHSALKVGTSTLARRTPSSRTSTS